MPFLQEPEPPRGVPQAVMPGIRRITARNPSVMTYLGTNTYLIDSDDGLTILDPGPNDPRHIAETIAAAGDTPIRRILLTHTHGDHWGGLAALKAATNAPVHAYKVSAKDGFAPDLPLDDGDTVAGLTAVFTPGHAADHLSFAYTHADGTRILFSGDHVMSWSSSIVSPPDGHMGDYYRSLERLLTRDDDIYLSGHGPTLPDPRALVRELLAHRQHREGTILAELRNQDWNIAALAAKLYHKTDRFLIVAAQRNVLAHLLKLKDENLVRELEPETTPHPDSLKIPPAPGEVESESGGQVTVMQRDALRRFGIVK
jgi:glyoxylase-like metal-dependent hydrolase (beta-lactamase superfamily II)